MTDGAVSAENLSKIDEPVFQQAVNVPDVGFTNILTKTTFSNGKIDLDAIFEEAGRRYNLSPNLLKAVAKIESGFRPDVTSTAGAMGIMQLMPGTARGLGVTDPYDPVQNIMGGAKYLRDMLDKFGDVRLALAAYNSGPNNVTKYNGVPPFCENYVKKVLENMGGDITAGMVTYTPAGDTKKSGSFALGEAFTQMLLVKIIEMQMNSSQDDKNKVF